MRLSGEGLLFWKKSLDEGAYAVFIPLFIPRLSGARLSSVRVADTNENIYHVRRHRPLGRRRNFLCAALIILRRCREIYFIKR